MQKMKKLVVVFTLLIVSFVITTGVLASRFVRDMQSLSAIDDVSNSVSDEEGTPTAASLIPQSTVFSVPVIEDSYEEHSFVAVEDDSSIVEIERVNLLSRLNFEDMLFIAPKTDQEGRLVGAEFGPSSELFFEFGLSVSDTIKYIDHYDMSDEQQSLEIIYKLPELRSITLTIDREGRSETHFIDLDFMEESLASR